MTDILIITGPPGVGKTDAGRALARRSTVRSLLLDTDGVAGIRPFSVTPAFLKLAAENISACIRNAETWAPSLVIVTGAIYSGGILDGLQWLFDDPRYRVVIVLLQASPERIDQRVRSDLKGQDGEGRLRWGHLGDMAPSLIERGAHTIDTDDRSIIEVADELAALVRRPGPKPAQGGRVLTVAQAGELAVAALAPCALDDRYRDRIVDVLVRNELEGYASHGLMRVSEYRAALSAGEMDGHAVPAIERVARNVLKVEARRCPGAVTSDAVVDALSEVVRDDPVGIVAMRESSHVGRLGLIGRRCAELGFAVAGFVNTGGHGLRVLPFGGARPLFGTDPVLFAFPTADGPVVADFSTSNWAEGRVRKTMYERSVLPEGPLLDAQWRPVTDVRAFYAEPPSAFLAPMGGADAGFRGTALALWCEYLAGMVAGAGFPGHPSAAFSNGALFVALRPDAVGRDRATVADEAAELIAALRSVPPARGFAPPRPSGSAPPAEMHGTIRIPTSLYDELLRMKEGQSRDTT